MNHQKCCLEQDILVCGLEKAEQQTFPAESSAMQDEFYKNRGHYLIQRFFDLNEKKILTAVLAVLTLYFLRFTFSSEWFGDQLGRNDWDLHFFYLESVRKPAAEFFQIPFWNPYYTGGMPVLENPQTKFFSLSFILSLFLGSIIALKLSVTIFYIAGSFGAAYLFRNTLRMSFPGALFSSILFLFCGWHFQHIYPGHGNFFSTPLIVWLAAFFVQYLKKGNISFLFLFSITVCILLSEGNIHIFLYTYLLLLISFLYCLFYDRKSAYRILSASLTGLAFSSYRLLPEAEFLFTTGVFYHPADRNFLNPADLWKIFTASSQHPELSFHFQNQEYRWWEYGNYTGSIPFIVFICLTGFLKRKDIPLILLTVFTALYSLGNFHPLSPANIFSHLPGFSNMRCHSRWTLFTVFFFSIQLGILITRMQIWISEKKRNRGQAWFRYLSYLAVLILCIVLYNDLNRKNAKLVSGIFSIPYSAMNVQKTEFLTVREIRGYGGNSAMLPAILSGISVKEGYETLNRNTNQKSVEDTDYKGEYYLENTDNIRLISKTPSRLSFSVSLREGNTLHLNMNYSGHWKTDRDLRISVNQGLMKIELPEGTYNFDLYYSNPYFWIGFWITLVSMMLTAFQIYRTGFRLPSRLSDCQPSL